MFREGFGGSVVGGIKKVGKEIGKLFQDETAEDQYKKLDAEYEKLKAKLGLDITLEVRSQDQYNSFNCTIKNGDKIETFQGSYNQNSADYPKSSPPPARVTIIDKDKPYGPGQEMSPDEAEKFVKKIMPLIINRGLRYRVEIMEAMLGPKKTKQE